MKKKKIIYLGVIISLIFIFFILKNINFEELKKAFSRAEYIYLLPALIIYLCSFLFRSLRWRYLLEHEKQISYGSLFSCLMIGFMANQVLPARIGEFVRAYVLGKKEKISKSLSFGTIVIERLWDGLTLLLFLSIILAVFPMSPLFRRINYLGAIIFSAILIFMIILTFWKGKTLKFLRLCLSFLPHILVDKLINILSMFIDGFKVLRKKRHLFLTSITSIFIWLIESIVYFIVAKSFGLAVPFYGMVLVLILINVGVMIPSSPGYVGTFEGFCILGLSFFGISKGTALGFAITMHALMSLPIILIGLAFLWRENISWAEIKKT